MTDQLADDAIDSLPEDANRDPEGAPATRDDNARSNIEQAVEARSDALKRGEGGHEPETFTSPGMPDGVGGTAA